MKVLIVDDNPLNRDLLADPLTAEGHTVLAAEDGVAALSLLESHKVDAIISDILMPRMDGYRLCHEVRSREHTRNVPFLFYTATYISEADEKLALDLGADAFLRKPAGARVILQILQRVTQDAPRGTRKAPLAEADLMKEYSERLVAKLEEKNHELARQTAEHKAASDKLRLFRALVDRSNDAFEIIEPETGRFVDMNERGREDLGYTREELLALTVFDIDPAVKREDWPRLLQSIRDSGSAVIEGVHRRKDGREFPVEVNAHLVRLDREYLVAAVRDISARKNAEAVVRAASERVAHRQRTRLALELALLAVLSLGLYELAAHFDWLETVVQWLAIRQIRQIDELILVVVFVSAGLTFIALRRWRDSQADAITEQHVGEALRLLHGELDERVRQRTAELAIANDALHKEIANHKLTEQALHRSGEEFKDLFENAPIGYHEINAEGRLVRVNQTELRMLGRTAGEMIDQFVWKVSAEQEVSRRSVMAKLRGEQPPKTFERTLRRKDGSTFPVLINDQLVKNKDGAVVGIRTMIQDITERKRAEARAAREHARFQFIFDSLPVGVTWMLRDKPETRIVNPAHARITGVPVQQCQNLALYREATHPEDRVNQDQLHQRLVAGEIDQYTIEKRYLHPDGTGVVTELTVHFFRDPATGDVQEISALVDLTERKQAEEGLRESNERFLQLAENITEVFWITDVDSGKIHYLSPAYETVWGRSCESLYQAPDTWNDATHPDDRERVRKAFDVAAQRNAFDETYRILRPDGSVRWVRDRGFPIRNAEGEIYRLVGVAEDITQQRKLEDQLRQSQKMEAIGTLAGGIAHDFNNILAAMNGYAELARMKLGAGSPVADYLDHVLQAGKRATALVKQILTFSRRQEHARAPVQLGEIVGESVKLLRAGMPSTIELSVSLAASLPSVLADATQIHQIVMNLGTNALHALRDQRGRLEINVENFSVDAAFAETHPKMRPGPYVRLTVADNGCGMSRETMSHIFEPFFTTKGPGEGTGLGLAVVHGIVESHDGAISVYSQPGEGAIFHIYFPAHGENAIAQMPKAGTVPNGTSQRILYVDDEEMLTRLGQKTLEHLGYRVEIETNAVKALERVRANSETIDLVITDQTMPGMTGVELAAELHKLRPGLPVILTTGYSATLTPEKIRAAGVRELLMKPHTVETLSAAVHRALTQAPA